MITQDVRYAMMFVKGSEFKDQVTVNSIARQYGMSAKFLEQIAGKLRKAGIISGARGRTGGYRLAQREVTLVDILSALGHPLPSISCRLTDECRGGAMCQERELEAQIIGTTNDQLQKVTVL